MAIATLPNPVVQKDRKVLACPPPAFVTAEVHKAKPLQVLDPPRPADGMAHGGFASAEEKADWDALSDEAWTNMDRAE